MKGAKMRMDLQHSCLREFSPDIPFMDRKVTLILIDGQHNLLATKTITGKCDLVDSMERRDRFYVAWTGNWSTDIFELNHKQVKELYQAWKRR